MIVAEFDGVVVGGSLAPARMICSHKQVMVVMSDQLQTQNKTRRQFLQSLSL